MTARFSRRSFLAAAAGLSAAAALPALSLAADAKPKRIVLRSAWQTISLADLSETPGDLALLERHLPDAEVTLWPMHLSDPFELMLRRRFPKVTIVTGDLDPKSRQPTDPALKAALDNADQILHGSGPFVVGSAALEHARAIKKPFGVVGVSLLEADDRIAALLASARFVFARETATLAMLHKAHVGEAKGGTVAATVGVSPDSAFAFDLRDDARATTFLKSVGLEAGGFLCCVPRLRYTPFRKAFAADDVARRQAISDRFAEPDHAKMRAAIVAWVRKTNRPVLVCPEMTYQIGLMDKLLIDPLPADVKKHVRKRDTFWLPNEAASVYARAGCVLSFEAHSPILALSAGTPAVHLRQPTDGPKGQTFRDVGLSEWIHEADDATPERVAETVLAIAADEAGAREKAKKATAAAAERQKAAFGVVRGVS